MEHHVAEVIGLLAECVVLLQGLVARKCFGQGAQSGDVATPPDSSLDGWPNIGDDPRHSLGE